MEDELGVCSILTADFDYELSKQWIRQRRTQFHGIIIAYVLLVWSAHFSLKSANPLSLRLPLAAWNALLAAFSLVGFLKVFPALISAVSDHGLVSSYTQIGPLQTDPAPGYWTLLWVLSKVSELFDTFFILARKRPLRFMHWFHHAMSILFGTINFAEDNAYLVWVVCMNFFIHSLMYCYYLFASLGVRLPRWLAQTITTLQMIQFLVIIIQLGHIALLQLAWGVDCAISGGGFTIGLFTTSIYLKLWISFYQEQYLK